MRQAVPGKVLIVDVEKCTGCRLCEVICSFYKESECNPARSRIHVLKWEREGLDIPMLCLHCDAPVCEAVCPMNAIYKNEKTGAVLINYDLCIGCRMCVLACPFGGVSIDPEEKRVIKCDLCGGDPACVKFCSAGAIQFIKRTRVALMKKRDAVEKLSELIKNVILA